MTVKELIAILRKYPKNAYVEIADHRLGGELRDLEEADLDLGIYNEGARDEGAILTIGE